MIGHMRRFSEKVEFLCGERGWNRAELARRIRVSKTTAGYWFDGDRKPYDDKLVALARLFSVPVDYLADDSLDEPPAPPSEDEVKLIDYIRSRSIPFNFAIEALVNAAQVAGGSRLTGTLAARDSAGNPVDQHGRPISTTPPLSAFDQPRSIDRPPVSPPTVSMPAPAPAPIPVPAPAPAPIPAPLPSIRAVPDTEATIGQTNEEPTVAQTAVKAAEEAAAAAARRKRKKSG